MLTATICITLNNSLKSEIYFPMSFLFKDYSLVEVIHLSIRCNKTKLFLWNTYNSDRNGVSKQNTHNKHPQKDKNRKSYLVWKQVIPPFLKSHHYFTNSSLFVGKTWKMFLQKFENSNPLVREFIRINYILFSLKSPENLRSSDNAKRNRS